MAMSTTTITTKPTRASAARPSTRPSDIPAIDPRDAGFAEDARIRFAAWADGLAADPLIASHDDADGLSSAALLARAWEAARGTRAAIRLVGRGQNAWDETFAAELGALDPTGLIIADLGIAGRRPLPARPLAVIDHHVPTGTPDGATVISGYGREPTPSTSVLAHWSAAALGDTDGLDWLAAIGLVGDYGDKADFPLIARAKKRYGAGKLREAVSLVNAPRRSASGDAAAALSLLLKASGPADVVSGEHPETEACRAAQEEVKAAVAEGRRQPPRFGSRYGADVAIIRVSSPCQIHPLVAQSWTGRLRKKDRPGVIVFAANDAFQPGHVSFAGRASGDVDIIDLLARHRPEGADPTRYGNGHPKASGGTLPVEAWNSFARDLGFGPDVMV